MAYEAGVLGAILIDSSLLPDISDILCTEDFEMLAYQEIYQTALDMQTEGKPIDAMTMSGEMKRRSIHTAGTDRLLVDLMGITPTTVNAVLYAKEVKKLSHMRQIHQLLDEAKEYCTDPNSLTDMLMDRLRIIEQGKRKGETKTMAAVSSRFVLWARGEGDVDILTSGHSRLDKIWSGMKPGQLIVVSARPGVGKSAFATNLAYRAAKGGRRAALFSCEMEDLEIMQRLVSTESGVKMDNIVNRSFFGSKDGSGESVAKAVNALKELPILIDDNPAISTLDIRRTLQTEPGIGLVLIDYAQLMTPTKRGENRNLELGEITRTLKVLAKEFQVPVVLLSQLSRKKDETDEPALVDLRDSGSIEQDADTVIMLWKLDHPAQGDMQKVGVKVAKNRQGKSGTVVMYFDGERMRFLETAEEYTPKKGRGRTFEAANRYDPDFPWEVRQA